MPLMTLAALDVAVLVNKLVEVMLLPKPDQYGLGADQVMLP